MPTAAGRWRWRSITPDRDGGTRRPPPRVSAKGTKLGAVALGRALLLSHPPSAASRPASASAYRDSPTLRSEEHTSELQSLMRISYAVFCLKNKKTQDKHPRMSQRRA